MDEIDTIQPDIQPIKKKTVPKFSKKRIAKIASAIILAMALIANLEGMITFGCRFLPESACKKSSEDITAKRLFEDLWDLTSLPEYYAPQKKKLLKLLNDSTARNTKEMLEDLSSANQSKTDEHLEKSRRISEEFKTIALLERRGIGLSKNLTLERAFLENPNDSEVIALLAQNYAQQSKTEKAKAYVLLAKTLEMNKEDSFRILFTEAAILQNEGKYSESIKLLEAHIDEIDEQAYPLFSGNAHALIGHSHGWLLQKEARSVGAHTERADIHYSAANNSYGKVLTLLANNEEGTLIFENARRNLITLSLIRGQYQKAELELRTALSKYSGNMSLQNEIALRGNLGAALFEQKKYSKAEAELEKILDLIKNDKELHSEKVVVQSRLVVLYRVQQREKEANELIAIIEKALERDIHNTAIRQMIKVEKEKLLKKDFSHQ